MAKSFDVSKFRKDLTKSISGMSTGFNDPTDWIQYRIICIKLSYLRRLSQRCSTR